MKTYISLLRGINVSGQNRIRMPELKGVYESLALVNVATYIQSGNVLFSGEEQDPAALARAIEAKIERAFGSSVRVFLYNKNHFQQLIDRNPFLQSRNEDAEKLHVTFLSDLPSEPAVSNLVVPAGISDEFLLYDNEIFLFCPNGYGKTKLSNSFFERKLRVSATTRNWKTVNALYEMANQR